MKMKPFDQVQIGDIGFDYFNQPCVIHDKGNIVEMVEKYGSQSPTGLDEFEDSLGRDLDQIDAVVIDTEPSPLEGFTKAIFIYDYDGVYVQQNN